MTLLTCELRAQNTVRLPYYPGTTIRGALGRALRTLVCDTGYLRCTGCERVQTCTYGTLWESPPPLHVDVQDIQGFETPPKPYIVEPVWTKTATTLQRGETLRFRLKLFGRARNALPWLILALKRAAQQGLGQGRKPLSLSRVTASGPDNAHTTLFTQRDGLTIQKPAPLWTLNLNTTHLPPPKRASRVRLEFSTPLYLKSQGHLLEHFDPNILTRALCKRLDLLSTCHHPTRTLWTPEYFHTLSKTLHRWDDQTHINRFQRVSMLQNKRVNMCGLTGNVTLDHVPPDLISLWKIAEHTHVGKQTTFGFGHIKLHILPRRTHVH